MKIMDAKKPQIKTKNTNKSSLTCFVCYVCIRLKYLTDVVAIFQIILDIDIIKANLI